MGSHYCVHTFTNPAKYKPHRNMSIRYLLHEIRKTLLLFLIFDLIEFINDNDWTIAKMVENVLNRPNDFIY